MEHLDDPFVGSSQDEIDILSPKGKEQLKELESEDSEPDTENPFSDEAPYYNMLADIEIAKINQRAELLKSVLSQARPLKLDTTDLVLEAADRFAAWIGGTGAEAGETAAGTAPGLAPEVPPYLRY